MRSEEKISPIQFNSILFGNQQTMKSNGLWTVMVTQRTLKGSDHPAR